MKRRMVAMLLCLVMLGTCMGAALLLPPDIDLIDKASGAAVSEVTVPKYGRVTLTPDYESAAELGYQWQISSDGKSWVSILGQTDESINLSYAMVCNMLSAEGTAQVRCLVASGDDEYKSDAVEVMIGEPVSVQPMTEEAAAAPVMLMAAAPVDEVMTMAEGGAADVKQTYNIVINYKFENNEIVSDPYTANLAEGSSFSATVTFPTVQGYLPYVDDVQQNLYTFNIASVSEDVTINAVYKPTNVNYTVIHYQQNVNDDNYTEVERETKQGLTASQVPEVAKTYEGFYNLLYERPNIAADGSTIIEIYYDRYYYLMNFDMDGGYGTEPVYARYGAGITAADPTKAGYTFDGWSETKDGAAVNLPTTMPAANKTYYAIWTPAGTAKVTVVFWGENADDEGYSYLADYTKVINLKPGREFTYTEGEMMVCDKEAHTHTDACIVCGKTEHTHSALGGSCYTLTCTIESHTHGTGCYAGVGSESWSGSTAKPNNPNEGQVYEGRFGTYIYIKGTWYDYTGSTASGSIAPTTCGKTESTHTHTDSCYTLSCTTEAHTHDNKCYSCRKEQHSHNSDCYMQGAGLDSKLWKFVKSDTIKVAADGSSVVNVYYDRTEFTLTFIANGNTVATIKAKWGADIHGEFKKAPFDTTYNGRAWACTERSKYSYALQTLDRMPKFDAKFDLYNKSSDTLKTIYYYTENVGANVSDSTWPSNQNNFTLLKEVDTYFNFATYDEEYHEIEGFTRYNASAAGFNGNEKHFSDDKLYLYYLRNSYTLTFNDQYNNVKTEETEYGAQLSTYKDYVPEVPSAYEPGSVEFGGWYQNPQCTGEEYKLDEHTMPASDMILYAKWAPVNRTVKFYLTETSTEVYKPEKAATEAGFTIPHGESIAEEYVNNHLTKDAMLAAMPNGDYTFVMWYYYEDGVKTPFDPTMQIRKDLTLYGEWSSNTLKNYTVQFVLKDDHSVKVADDLTGSGLAGTTKTFDAKGGTDLYAGYKEGYFPTVQSQSLLLDIEEESLIVTFEYVPMPAVPYTVKYVEKDTGNSLADDKVVSDNRKAVVTETFKPVTGYMPDAYQKRLVITADGENVLYFYYSKDTEHAYYKITHNIQNTDGTTWTEYASSQVVGDIGNRYTASPMTISGYTYEEIKYVVNGVEVMDITAEGAKLTADGLEINLYYVRNEYPYQVRYLEQGTGKQLAEPKNGTGKYGEIISESAIDIDNYDKVEPSSATLNVRIDEGEGAPEINIITFYYKEKEVTINYEIVGPTGCGTLDRSTETLKVLSGTAQGSTASTEGNTFKFVGWYKDADCTDPLSTDAKYTPAKMDGKNVAATYYAKFDYNLTTLTIKKACTDPYEESDMFIFTVKKGSEEVAKVAMRAGEEVTISGLTVGETYTVAEDNAWSWRYKDQAAEEITLTADKDTNVVTVTNEVDNYKWLSASTYAINKCVKQVGEDVLEIIKNIFGE